MTVLQSACWGDLLLKLLVNHSDPFSGFTTRVTELYGRFSPKSPFGVPGRREPCTRTAAGPQETQVQGFRAEVLENRSSSSLLKAFLLGEPSIEH